MSRAHRRLIRKTSGKAPHGLIRSRGFRVFIRLAPLVQPLYDRVEIPITAPGTPP